MHYSQLDSLIKPWPLCGTNSVPYVCRMTSLVLQTWPLYNTTESVEKIYIETNKTETEIKKKIKQE